MQIFCELTTFFIDRTALAESVQPIMNSTYSVFKTQNYLLASKTHNFSTFYVYAQMYVNAE